MPIYEYDCQDCGHTLEVLQRSSTPLETCGEHCESQGEHRGTGRLRKRLSAHNTISGFTRSPRHDPAPRGGGCGHCHQPGGCAFE